MKNYVEDLLQFQSQYRELASKRQAFDARLNSDAAFKGEIEMLYSHFVGTFHRYCGNCWHDAFMYLLRLKNMNKKQTFHVIAGTLLHDPVNRDVNYMLTPQRLAKAGDDLALRHLAHNPRAVEYFEKPLPENLDKMIAEYLEREKGAKAVDSRPQKAGKATTGKGRKKTAAKSTEKVKANTKKDDAEAKMHDVNKTVEDAANS